MEVQTVIRALPPFLRRHKLLRAFALVGDPLQHISFNDGAEAFVDLRHGGLRKTLIDAAFDPEYFRIARAFLRDGGTCFDVGANAGLCSFGLVSLCPTVQYHLFEPNPQLWPVLRRSLTLYPSTDMRLVEGAVGERPGKAFLDAENLDHDSGQAFVNEAQGTEIRVLTLDDYIRDANIGRVDFMKMDIEGYELFAMEGARDSIAAGKLPVVYFELKAPLLKRFGKTVGDVLARFRSLGYRLFHVRDEDFRVVTASRDIDIRGLKVAPVGEFPESLWADLLAIHETSSHLAPPRPDPGTSR
jgi:FkbM family methyltransferase